MLNSEDITSLSNRLGPSLFSKVEPFLHYLQDRNNNIHHDDEVAYTRQQVNDAFEVVDYLNTLLSLLAFEYAKAGLPLISVPITPLHRSGASTRATNKLNPYSAIQSIPKPVLPSITHTSLTSQQSGKITSGSLASLFAEMTPCKV